MKLHNFRGDLTDTSAKTKTLFWWIWTLAGLLVVLFRAASILLTWISIAIRCGMVSKACLHGLLAVSALTAVLAVLWEQVTCVVEQLRVRTALQGQLILRMLLSNW